MGGVYCCLSDNIYLLQTMKEGRKASCSGEIATFCHHFQKGWRLLESNFLQNVPFSVHWFSLTIWIMVKLLEAEKWHKFTPSFGWLNKKGTLLKTKSAFQVLRSWEFDSEGLFECIIFLKLGLTWPITHTPQSTVVIERSRAERKKKEKWGSESCFCFSSWW